MSSFKTNKHLLRELLIYFFNLKKSAAETHRLLVETYVEAALIKRNLFVHLILIVGVIQKISKSNIFFIPSGRKFYLIYS